MTVVLETARLALKTFSVADAAGFYELNLDPETLRYTGDIPFRPAAEAEWQPKIVGDRVGNTLNVKTRKLDLAGPVPFSAGGRSSHHRGNAGCLQLGGQDYSLSEFLEIWRTG